MPAPEITFGTGAHEVWLSPSGSLEGGSWKSRTRIRDQSSYLSTALMVAVTQSDSIQGLNFAKK